jgi:TonB-dependent receptor
MRSLYPFAVRRALTTGAVLLAGTAWPALAQPAESSAQPQPGDEQPETAQVDPDSGEEILVTGFRGSLLSSTNAKREATGFIDTIFAEDIGKFPDTNIAESFNRIPGVTISREITGEGLNVSIRGLGTNFTRVTLNNAPIAIASTGRTDAQSTNREVDLDLFPTELFTQLTVSKSPSASMLEGGAAGVVNMRSARPFDNPGTHVTYSLQGTNNSVADKWGYRGSLLASTTMGNFGILAGVAAVRNKVRVTGFETIGWTNPNLSAAQCGAATGCNSTGGGNWTIPSTVPANAGNGLTPGTVIDRAFLLANNPGATIQQIDNGLIPRLGRPAEEFGTKDRISAIAALEYRGDSFHAYVDGMYGKKENDLERIDVNWVGRNGAAIPLNTTYDRDDCSQGCVVTGGTYANAQWFLEYRPHIEDVEFWGVNPGFEWDIADTLKLSLQANYTKSNFHRESPTVLVITPASSGVTVEFSNDGTVPVIETNIDLNDPANFGWPGGRVNIQDERRRTYTKGVRGDLIWGDEDLNLRVGGAYDDVSRRITAFDNAQAWQNAVCGNRPSVFVPTPNTQPPCQGLNQPGAAPPGYPSYPAIGTGFSTGMGGPVTYLGSLIPNSAIRNFLMPGPSGFVTVDWDAFKQASNYDEFHDNAPEAGSSNTGASGGYVRERTFGWYAEANGDTDLGEVRVRWNAGARWVHTKQRIGGRVSVADPRNVGADPDGAGPLLAPVCPAPSGTRDGSCYPNIVDFQYVDNGYYNFLPSASAAVNITDNAIFRASASRTMTRPDPNAQLPGLNFSSPSADQGTLGNSALSPYLSTNIDLGFEYYTGQEGFLGVAAFRKAITGFTTTARTTVPFSALAQYGVNYDTLTPTQQQAIDSRGGPNTATVTLQQQVNAEGTLKVNGLEFQWVQPLDFLLGRYLGINGFGFTANLTLVDQKGSGAAPAIALGVADLTYNITAYYENHGVTARLSTTFQRGAQVANTGQNSIPLAGLFSDDYQQWDFSSSFDLGEILGNQRLPQLTFDVINLFKADQRQYFQFENAAFTYYNPGRTIMVGLRGRF